MNLRGGFGFRGEVAQNIVQDALILVIFMLIIRIDADIGGDRLGLAIRKSDVDIERSARLETFNAGNGHGLIACQAEAFPAFAFLEFQRENAHADEV